MKPRYYISEEDRRLADERRARDLQTDADYWARKAAQLGKPAEELQSQAKSTPKKKPRRRK